MINVGILHSRRQFIDLQLKLFSKCKRRDQFKIHLLTQGDTTYCDNLEKYDLDVEVVRFGYNDNFMSKVRYLISLGGNILRMDEDVFIGPYTLDYMVEKQYRLDDLLLIAPCFITGVPTFDIVFEDYYDKFGDYFEGIYEEIEKTKISPVANLINPDAPAMGISHEYNVLQHYLKSYNRKQFLGLVGNIPHVYRGFHPIRINGPAHNMMINLFCSNRHLLFEQQDYTLEGFDYRQYPYLCNHVHLIKAEKWKKAIEEFPHGFDEVSLNEYRRHNDLKYGFIHRGLAIHLMYSNLVEHPSEMNPHSDPRNNEFELSVYNHLKRYYAD